MYTNTYTIHIFDNGNQKRGYQFETGDGGGIGWRKERGKKTNCILIKNVSKTKNGKC